MMDYQEADNKQYIKFLHEYAYGHLCYECRRRLETDDAITIQLLGPLPIYHHSACFYTETELQAIVEKNSKGEIIY